MIKYLHHVDIATKNSVKVKFMFSKKATKIDEIFIVYLTLTK